MLLKINLIISLIIPSVVYGQSITTSNLLSNVGVYSQIGLDTYDSFTKHNKKKALLCQAERLIVNNVVNQVVKHYISKERPDHSDFKSFYSSHTSNSFVSSEWDYGFGLTIGVTVGALRIKARKHNWKDVAVGALAGYVSQSVCDKQD